MDVIFTIETDGLGHLILRNAADGNELHRLATENKPPERIAEEMGQIVEGAIFYDWEGNG